MQGADSAHISCRRCVEEYAAPVLDTMKHGVLLGLTHVHALISSVVIANTRFMSDAVGCSNKEECPSGCASETEAVAGGGHGHPAGITLVTVITGSSQKA